MPSLWTAYGVALIVVASGLPQLKEISYKMRVQRT